MDAKPVGNLSGKALAAEDFPGVTLDGSQPSGLSVKGYPPHRGYIHVRINKVTHRAHRVVYALAHGECPSGAIVDHIDQNRSNNRVDNLRLVTPSESCLNRAMPKTFNKRKGSPHRGVQRFGDRFRVVVHRKSFGVYDTLEEAVRARESVKEV